MSFSFLNTKNDISKLKKENNYKNKNTHLLNFKNNNNNNNGDNDVVNLYNNNQQPNLPFNFRGTTSISDVIDASVTLEDFEEQERQIVKELNDPVDVLESKSLQNPQSLNMFKNSISINSDELKHSKSDSTVSDSSLHKSAEDSNFQAEQNIEFEVLSSSNKLKTNMLISTEKYDKSVNEIEPFLLDNIKVANVEPFIKISTSNQNNQNNHLTQSNSKLINFKLDEMPKNVLTSSETPIKCLIEANKNKDQIDAWMETMREFSKTKKSDKIIYIDGQMPDIDELMQEWSPEMEIVFNNAILPNSKIDATLEEYIDLCLAIVDIPVYNNRRIQSLHTFFTLYSEFKNSQHFKNFETNNKVFDSFINNENINQNNFNVNNRLEL